MAKGTSRQQVEQELITYEDIRGILDSCLKVKEHPIPQGMVGSLYTVDGKTEVAETIFHRIEQRSKLFKGRTKPPKEEGNG